MLLLLLAAGLAGLNYLALQEFKQKVGIQISKVSMNTEKSTQAAFSTLYFNVAAVVVNPTSYFFTLKTLFFQIIYDGKQVASVQISSPVKVLAHTSSTLNLPIQIKAADLLGEIAMIVGDIKSKSLFVTVKGTCDFGIGTLNVDKRIQLL